MTQEQEPHPRDAVGEMCTCGHPQINHCCSGHMNEAGDMIALVTGHGSCLACEDQFLRDEEAGLNPDAKDPKYCNKFTFACFVYKGDDNYKKFKRLFDGPDAQ